MTSACPKCRAIGRKVSTATTQAILKPEVRWPVADARFCRTRECPIVYYGANGETVGEESTTVRVGAKHDGDDATLCYCFGYTVGDVRSEVAGDGSATLADRIRKRIADEGCACETRNPAGVCCLGEVNAAERGKRLACC